MVPFYDFYEDKPMNIDNKSNAEMNIDITKNYDVIIVGAGAGGVFASYELCKLGYEGKVLVIDRGAPLERRNCPIKLGKTPKCIKCNPCHIMNGYGGAGTLSDGKYNITTEFGGDLHKVVGYDKAMEMMEYVDSALCSMGGSEAKLYSTADTDLKTKCLQNNLHLLSAKVRHLGTDRNINILHNIYEYVSSKINFEFYTACETIDMLGDGSFLLNTNKGNYTCDKLVMASGRSGSKWIVSKGLNSDPVNKAKDWIKKELKNGIDTVSAGFNSAAEAVGGFFKRTGTAIAGWG